MEKEKIEPCDICKMRYTKEMCKIANKFFQGDDPCYCQAIKKVEKLINKNKKLKQEIDFLNIHLAEAQPEDWDLDSIHEDALTGRDEYTGENNKPNIPYAKWLQKRYNLCQIKK